MQVHLQFHVLKETASYEELHNLYASPDIIRMTESRMMRWAGHMARMGHMTNAYKILI
jgi:hypothetical protein